MNSSDHNNYEDTFYIVPRYIRKIPGITFAFMDVYETIFQFWNKNKNCFLSEESLCERTGFGRTQIYEALKFFEKHNELKRIKRNGKRYLVRPEKIIETDCSEITPTSGGADNNVRRSGHSTSGGADHNIKNINKEINKTPCVFFEEFWELFPTKKNKHLCHKLWQTKNLEAIGLEIIQKLQNQIANDDQWKRNFNPHPSTYLSNKLWLDEISKPKIYQVSPPPKNKPTYDDMDTSWRNLECL